jgi:hypothetical protein
MPDIKGHFPVKIGGTFTFRPQLLDLSKADGSPWTNPAFSTSDPGWSGNVVQGKTFDGTSAHPFEWVSVLNPQVEQDDQVGLSGTAVNPNPAGTDLPFTHPFGNDFEFTIAPDPAYAGLLATANKDPSNTAYAPDWAAAKASSISVPVGLFPVEIEESLVPPSYRCAHGDRVAVYGRWIIDAGHGDFHAEIHPPLLMARARPVDSNENVTTPGPGAATLFQLWSRPYQAGQLFTDGKQTGLPLKDYISNIAETSGDIKAFPPILAKPFQGTHVVGFTVRPPVQLAPPHGAVGAVGALTPRLECSYHFTVNGACQVQVIPSPADPGSVLVILRLNSAGYPALPEPPSTMQPVNIDTLVNDAKAAGIDIGWLADTWSKIKEAQGWVGSIFGGSGSTGDVQFRTFAAPQMSRTQDGVNVVPFTPLPQLPSSSQATDNSQPFPVYGWLKLFWQTPTMTTGAAGSL